MSEPWTQAEAIALCSSIHPLTNQCGCYVALTGGLLYKEGPRKDLDLVFYRIRQVDGIDKKLLFALLDESLGIKVVKGFGFCHKALSPDGRTIDMLFPEEDRVCSKVDAGDVSGAPLEEDDPDPDPKPRDEVAQAIVAAQCSQGHEFNGD